MPTVGANGVYWKIGGLQKISIDKSGPGV